MELKPFKLPPSLVEFLQSDQPRIDLDGSPYDIDFIEFLALTDTVLMKAGRQKVLRVTREVDNYSSMVLVWNPKTKRIGYWDVEHEEHSDIATFEDFMLDPANHMRRVIEGHYAPPPGVGDR